MTDPPSISTGNPRMPTSRPQVRFPTSGPNWKGGSFTWVDPEVGSIARFTPKGFKPESLPDFVKLGNGALVTRLNSPGQTRRLAAQRVHLCRDKMEFVQGAIRALAKDISMLLSSRVAAVFLLDCAGANRDGEAAQTHDAHDAPNDSRAGAVHRGGSNRKAREAGTFVAAGRVEGVRTSLAP